MIVHYGKCEKFNDNGAEPYSNQCFGGTRSTMVAWKLQLLDPDIFPPLATSNIMVVES
jgi:hypothetical protein